MICCGTLNGVFYFYTSTSRSPEREKTPEEQDSDDIVPKGMYSRFARRSTARGSSTGLVTVGPTNV